MMSTLRTVLSRYPAIAQPLEEPEALGNAGGFSGSRFWRFGSGMGRLALRAWPVDGPSESALARIHSWLLGAARLDFVPEPLASLDGRTFVAWDGRLWELTRWLTGAADPARPPTPARVFSAFAALGAFHQAMNGPAIVGPSGGIRARLHEVEQLLGGGFDSFALVLDRSRTDPLHDPAARWLEAARGAAPGLVGPLTRACAIQVPIQPCIRDIRPEHILFEENRVTGLVDFGAMDLETVATDLARLLSEWGIDDRVLRRQALDAYHAVRPLSLEESALIKVFEDATALLGGARWIRWRFVEGRVFVNADSEARALDRLNARVSGRSPSIR